MPLFKKKSRYLKWVLRVKTVDNNSSVDWIFVFLIFNGLYGINNSCFEINLYLDVEHFALVHFMVLLGFCGKSLILSGIDDLQKCRESQISSSEVDILDLTISRENLIKSSKSGVGRDVEYSDEGIRLVLEVILIYALVYRGKNYPYFSKVLFFILSKMFVIFQDVLKFILNIAIS